MIAGPIIIACFWLGPIVTEVKGKPLQGVWLLQAVEAGGKRTILQSNGDTPKIVIKGNVLTFDALVLPVNFSGRFSIGLQGTEEVQSIDWEVNGKNYKGIYSLRGDSLEMVFAPSDGKERAAKVCPVPKDSFYVLLRRIDPRR